MSRRKDITNQYRRLDLCVPRNSRFDSYNFFSVGNFNKINLINLKNVHNVIFVCIIKIVRIFLISKIDFNLTALVTSRNFVPHSYAFD